MPISKGEFDAGRLDLTVPIVQILGANPEFAYTAQEIADRLHRNVERRATAGEVAAYLDHLVRTGMVQISEVGPQRWYTIASSRSD